MAINLQPLPVVIAEPVTLRFKASELDIDPSSAQILRIAVDYDVTSGGVTTSKTWTETPDGSQQFQIWRLLREVLGPLFISEGIVPPLPPTPSDDARAASPAASADPLAAIQSGPAPTA